MQLLKTYRLPLVTTGTQHLAARTKLKCNCHFTIIITQHSLNGSFWKLLLFFIFFLSVHLPTSHYLILYGYFFKRFLVSFLIVFLFAVSVIGTPEGLLTAHRCQLLLFLCCASVCGPSCCCSVGWKILGTYSSLSSPSVTTKTHRLMLPNVQMNRCQHRVLT